MSDWVQDSFGPLSGARLSNTIKPSWSEAGTDVQFDKASIDWLLDLRYRIVTGRENLKPDKRDSALASLQQELDSRAASGQLFTIEQVKLALHNLLENVIVDLGEMSESAKRSAEIRERSYGSDNTYFQYLENGRFLWGLKDHFNRLVAYDAISVELSKITNRPVAENQTWEHETDG